MPTLPRMLAACSFRWIGFMETGFWRWVFISLVIRANVVLFFGKIILFSIRLSRSVNFNFRPLFTHRWYVFPFCVDCCNPNLSGPCNTDKVGFSRRRRSSELSLKNHAPFQGGEIGHNGDLLGTEFSHTILIPTNNQLHFLSPSVDGRLLWYLTKQCYGQSKKDFEMGLPIILSHPILSYCHCYFVTSIYIYMCVCVYNLYYFDIANIKFIVLF